MPHPKSNVVIKKRPETLLNKSFRKVLRASCVEQMFLCVCVGGDVK